MCQETHVNPLVEVHVRLLNEEAIRNIAVGAAVLGTGGGGDTAVGLFMALEAIRRNGPIELLNVDEVPLDALILPTSMMGAPAVSIEKLPSGRELDIVFDDMQAALGKQAFATMPVEIGGGNALVPLILAARRKLPVIDADAMGRAFPEYQMVSFHLHGLGARIATFADERGNRATVHPIDGEWGERICRPLVDAMGASATVCDFPLDGDEVRRCAIPGTVTQAEKIGALISGTSKRTADTVVSELVTALNGYLLIEGKIVDLKRHTSGGFTRGSMVIEGAERDSGRRVTVNFQNEFLVAQDEVNVLATTPDLIILVDRETARAISTETLAYGMRVVLLACPCDAQWRSKLGIQTTGPRYFGYSVDYEPVESIARRLA
ncbi:DUF917 domain-containing protein [Paraburkholderia haematera]|jgi:Uncharacterized conserved protein|uniref:DUF917 domain-containing protein n=1 Tax=Paraburkholderia haematera TaxID=2793077 RepID=A0ABM8RPP5_9BURK|nr:DUF917 domain-containing protein [Paraburkholderia haematera]CAE6765107.1 hypothetical protein R69888_03596 [Paraburkholderia haematera]